MEKIENLLEPYKEIINSEFEKIYKNPNITNQQIIFNGLILNHEVLLPKVEIVADCIDEILNRFDILNKNHESKILNKILIECSIITSKKIAKIFKENINSVQNNSNLATLLTYLTRMLDFTSFFDNTQKEKIYFLKNLNLEIERAFVNIISPKIQTDNKSCYVATLAYGDINHPKVEKFRQIRDNSLSHNIIGRKFIEIYYKYSPSLVEKLKPYKRLNMSIRYCLDLILILKK